jgi:hypothetical protein
VRTLTWREYLAEAGAARAALFRHWELPGWSEEEERFADGVGTRAILAATHPGLEKEQLAALRLAAAEVGEHRAYGSSLERVSWSSTGVIPAQDLEFSLDAPEPPEEIAYSPHVIHSPSGQWGLIVSLDYTLAGGDARFVEALLDAWPPLVVQPRGRPRSSISWSTSTVKTRRGSCSAGAGPDHAPTALNTASQASSEATTPRPMLSRAGFSTSPVETA